MEQNAQDRLEALSIIRSHARGRALRPPSLPDKTTMTARISEEALEGLRTVAAQLGYIHSGHGNVSMLLEAIGTYTVQVVPTSL